MKNLSLGVRWKWLRLVLALLLPLHAGFAQAAMTLPAQAAGETVQTSQQLSDSMPCHEQVEPSPAPDHSSQHEDGCCKTGSCHCAAACGLPVTIARIAPQPGFIVSTFRYLSVPAASRPPDLRPPIG